MGIVDIVISRYTDADLRKMRDSAVGATIRRKIIDEIVWRAYLCATR